MAGLEAENEQLSKTLRMTSEELVPHIATLPERYESAMEVQALAHRVAVLEQLRPDIKRLPESLLEVVDLAAKLFGDKITFTEEARRSAAISKFAEINTAWRALRAVATHLYDIYRTGCDLEVEFRNRSGFELALTESAETKADKDLVRQRLVKSGSRYVFAGGHIKAGNKRPNVLRIHYYYPPEATTISIWHCGDHLETAGTKRGRGR